MSHPAFGVFKSLVMSTVLLVSTVASAQEQEPASDEVTTEQPAPTVLITGANRGLGLEFARQFSEAGATVIATARRPDAADDLNALGVRVEQLDVTDSESVAALVESIGDEHIDILINNAGISRRVGGVGSMNFDDVGAILQVNAIGPMRVTQALLPSLRKGHRKTIVNISSELGSIERNRSGGFHGYRESKAALNMFTRSLAGELRGDEFICIAMSPGWVRTDMGGSQAPLSPAQSIGGMIKVIDGLTLENSGTFYDYRGEIVDW